MFFVFRTVVAGCALEVLLCTIVVNEISYLEPPMDKFCEELVHGAEGMESSPVGWPVNRVELSCHPGIFFLNLFLHHWLLSFTANGLLKLGGYGTCLQVELSSHASDNGHLGWVRSCVGEMIHGESVSIYIQKGS